MVERKVYEEEEEEKEEKEVEKQESGKMWTWGRRRRYTENLAATRAQGNDK